MGAIGLPKYDFQITLTKDTSFNCLLLQIRQSRSSSNPSNFITQTCGCYKNASQRSSYLIVIKLKDNIRFQQAISVLT